MTFRTLLLAGAFAPMTLAAPALALDRLSHQAPPMVVAQADCVEGADCAAADQGAGKTRKERRQERKAKRQQKQEEQSSDNVGPDQQRGPIVQQGASPAETTTEAADPVAKPAKSGKRQKKAEPAAADAIEEPAADVTTSSEEPAQKTSQGKRKDRAVERARKRQQELKAKAGVSSDEAEESSATASGSGSSDTVSSDDEPTTAEKQLQAQGDSEQADRVRDLRRKLRKERNDAGVASSDQGSGKGEGKGNRKEAEGKVVERRGDRVLVDIGNGKVIVKPRADEGGRLLHDARDVKLVQEKGGRTRTVVYRDNGSEIVTVRDRYGNIIRRVRRTADGREVVLIDNRYPDNWKPPLVFQPVALPPLVVGIPQPQYVVDYGQVGGEQIDEVLLAPPVEPVERPYTLTEVTQNERLRSKMRRIDLDTITFEFGSSTITSDQTTTLDALGQAMERVISENPDEVYLIEGHTDAVGSDNDNLVLSDERAESVAVALSQNFDIPPENLVTEGYGEEYLKVDTQDPERQNRRVTVRRITPLLKADAQQ